MKSYVSWYKKKAWRKEKRRENANHQEDLKSTKLRNGRCDIESKN